MKPVSLLSLAVYQFRHSIVGLTQLYNLRARSYAPETGRFLSRDTWAYNFQKPLELNRYVYAAGNPTRYSDPSGWMAGETGPITQIQGAATQMSLRRFAAQEFVKGAVSGVAGYVVGKLTAAFLIQVVKPSYQPTFYPGELILAAVIGGFSNLSGSTIGSASIQGNATVQAFVTSVLLFLQGSGTATSNWINSVEYNRGGYEGTIDQVKVWANIEFSNDIIISTVSSILGGIATYGGVTYAGQIEATIASKIPNLPNAPIQPRIFVNFAIGALIGSISTIAGEVFDEAI